MPSLKIVGKKRGMIRYFDEKGNAIACTVISAEKNVVTQIKSQEKDGYQAIQLGAELLSDARKKNLGKPVLGHFSKAKVEPRKILFESRTSGENFEISQEIGLEIFAKTAFVDVTAISKGKGTQGVMKRYGFAGGRATHGNSRYHRGGGSTGMRSDPGRVLPLQKKPGRMGGDKVTIQHLRVLKVDTEKGYILLQGAVPGSRGAFVTIAEANKKVK